MCTDKTAWQATGIVPCLSINQILSTATYFFNDWLKLTDPITARVALINCTCCYNGLGRVMRKTIEHECKFCKRKTKMSISGPVTHLGIYWLKCERCNNNWRIPIKELEYAARF